MGDLTQEMLDGNIIEEDVLIEVIIDRHFECAMHRHAFEVQQYVQNL